MRYAPILPAEVRFRPFLLSAVMKSSGNKPPATLPAKGIYGQNDIKYSAKYWGVPLNQPANFFESIIGKSTAFPMRFLTALEKTMKM